MNKFLIKYLADTLFYWVSFFTAATAIIPLLVKQGQIYNRKYRWYKKLRWAGYLIIITSSLGIYFNNLQNIYNDTKTENKEVALRDSLRKSYNVTVDTMQKRFIDGNKEIINVVINSLGTYGYKLDSANSRLVKVVRDSSKTKIIVPDRPVVGICNGTGIELLNVKDNVYSFRVSFCSKDASSTEFKLDCHAILIDSLSGKYYYTSKFDFVSQDTQISKSEQLNRYFTVTTPIVFTDLCIYVNGTYMDFDKIKKYPLNQVYYYEIKSRAFGSITGPDRDLIVKFILDNKANWHYSSYKKSYN